MSTSITTELNRFLADSIILSTKIQNCHWNVTGVHFVTLHELFASQYKEITEAIDEIAERIRALKSTVRASMQDYLSITRLKEIREPISWDARVTMVLADHELISSFAAQLREQAGSSGDAVTEDLMVQRAAVHEKSAWMMRSILELAS
jgi:starvation-inducible DNA-binding protein